MLTQAKYDPIDLLAAMFFAESDLCDWLPSAGMRKSDQGGRWEEIDAGSRLPFAAMRPERAYTVDMTSDGRLIATHADYLVRHPAETVGKAAEIALMTSDRVKWIGVRRLTKTPKGVWVGSPGACLYELHYRESFFDGRNTYIRRIAALDKHGLAVPAQVVGSKGVAGPLGNEGVAVIMAASVIEDCHRSGAIRCEITDGKTIVAPIPDGDQKELFALRSGPLGGANRRKAILHHVMRHRRRSASGAVHCVSEHFRGVAEFEVDGLHVRLSANDKEAA